MVEKNKKKDKTTYYLLGILAFLILAWYMCWIIVPAIPNANCGGSSGQAGFSGGGYQCPSATGGEGECPTCDDPRCDPPYVYNETTGRCELCPAGTIYDTGKEECTPSGEPRGEEQGCCPDGYWWNSTTLTCYGESGYNFMCTNNSYYDTKFEKCICYDGYVQNTVTGCCVP